MNKYVVSLNNEKFDTEIFDHTLIVEDREYRYSISQVNDYSYHLRVNNKSFEISIDKLSQDDFRFLIKGNYFETIVRSKLEEIASETLKNKEKLSHKDTIKAPMPGLVLKVLVAEGDNVKIGESLLVLEAMKMENDIKSSASGTVKSVRITAGEAVEKDQVMIIIE